MGHHNRKDLGDINVSHVIPILALDPFVAVPCVSGGLITPRPTVEPGGFIHRVNIELFCVAQFLAFKPTELVVRAGHIDIIRAGIQLRQHTVVATELHHTPFGVIV